MNNNTDFCVETTISIFNVEELERIAVKFCKDKFGSHSYYADKQKRHMLTREILTAYNLGSDDTKAQMKDLILQYMEMKYDSFKQL
ncbi:MAG: hypothetical protein M0Q88_02970 [Bacilli bacterium]|nr:hypothetical protein [Bacilli bacterium]